MQVRGFTNQRQLAEAAGIHHTNISRIINNKSLHGLTLYTVDRLCEALDCQPGAILERVPDPVVTA